MQYNIYEPSLTLLAGQLVTAFLWVSRDLPLLSQMYQGIWQRGHTISSSCFIFLPIWLLPALLSSPIFLLDEPGLPATPSGLPTLFVVLLKDALLGILKLLPLFLLALVCCERDNLLGFFSALDSQNELDS